MATKLLKTLLAASLLSCGGLAQATIVEVTTNLGKFEINLYDESTPVTVQNFLNYVSAERYNGTVIHRSVPGFVIQGGGFEFDQQLPLKARPANPAIINEPKWSNVRATIAMAKQAGNPNSATNQWFISLVNNAANLDAQNSGFTVFGQISSADMAVVDAIAALPRFSFNGISDLPLRSYSTADRDDNKPLAADNFVVVESMVVVDARVNTVAGLTLVPNNAPPPANNDSSGGSFGWFLLPLGLLAFRRRG
ncbi:peptidylprolyl isomerase [Rheinheimera sp.]|uniref:peptidylprolyl isomerase n=1 Tax=Rheinheimera sp. TaxID=1869214 RepID=UPI002732C438|nr:peptidylprolyl isomerase [Rheinheimera sp.]MDP2716986.1 peptidylprolyl isomerase [Rheinheimera sp.]